MDKKYRLVENSVALVKYIKLFLIILLAVMEVVICAQYAERYMETGRVWILVAVVISCFILLVLETIDSFVINKPVGKYVMYGLDLILLLIICIFTGSTYLYILYGIVLTQIYISIDNLRRNSIMFGVGMGLYIISFSLAKIGTDPGSSIYNNIVSLLGDGVLGIAILGIHFIVTNFILKFYSTNRQLRSALKEADESRTELKEAYEELSRTAVYEERNRIAKDIHDNAGHSMTTVIMQTEAAKLLIDENPEEAKMRIISANMQAKNALEQMRESVHLLAGRTQVRSLREEIEEIIAQTIDGTELKVRHSLDEAVTEPERERFILNSVKECFVNGIRHGNATAFFIELKEEDGYITLLVSDNGKGLDGELKEGFGLRGIREKAEHFGGSCSFSSETGEGFETCIRIAAKSLKPEKGAKVE